MDTAAALCITFFLTACVASAAVVAHGTGPGGGLAQTEPGFVARRVSGPPSRASMM